jgi:hypothetical protein
VELDPTSTRASNLDTARDELGRLAATFDELLG